MNEKITIISVEQMTFTDKTTGEITPMTNITYLSNYLESERKVGYSVINQYVKGDKLRVLKNFINKQVNATYNIRVRDNKQMLIMSKIDNIELY